MNIKEEIKNFQKSRDLQKYTPLFSQKKNFDDLIDFILTSNEQKLVEYATWLCTHIVKDSSFLFKPYISTLIKKLHTETNESILRNLLKTVVDSKPSHLHDEDLLNLTLNLFDNPNHKVALHVYCIRSFIPIIKRNPELLNEIFSLIELKTIQTTPSLTASSKFFKKKLQTLNSCNTG
ncbi:MAG: hypothetical protein KJ941_07110 [Bacteroidetes bacterium]|nr:hypothetical protein [Bacteroidota bacterium]